MKTKGIGTPAVVAITIIIAIAGIGGYLVLKGGEEGVPAPAEFEVSNLTVSPSEAEPGESVTISVDVSNVGGEGTYAVELRIDGVIEETKSVTLGGGESTTVSFTVQKETRKSYSVEVGDLTQSFEVIAPAEFEISNLVISPDEIIIVESTTVSVDVKNTGGSEGTYEAILEIDGTQVDSKEVTLAPGETRTISFSETVNERGTHYVALGGLSDNFYAWGFEIIEVGTTDYIDPDTNQENPPVSVFTQGDTVYYYAIWRQYTDSFRYWDLFSLLRPGQDPSEGHEILTEGEGTIDFTEAITWNTLPTNTDTQTGTYLLTFSLVQFDETTGGQIGARVENTPFEIEPITYTFLELNEPYEDKDGMTVIVKDIEKVEKVGSIEITVSYTLKNETPDKEIDEKTFKLHFADGTLSNQYGFFGSLFPGESLDRYYTFEFLKTKSPIILEYGADFFSTAPEDTLKWRVD